MNLADLAADVRAAGSVPPPAAALPATDLRLGCALFVVDRLAAYYGESRALPAAFAEREREAWERLPDARRRAWAERARRLRAELDAEQIVDAEIVDEPDGL